MLDGRKEADGSNEPESLEKALRINRILRSIRDVRKLARNNKERTLFLNEAVRLMTREGGYSGSWITHEDSEKGRLWTQDGICDEKMDETQTMMFELEVPPCVESFRETSDPHIVTETSEACERCEWGKCCSQNRHMVVSRMCCDGNPMGFLGVLIPVAEFVIDDELELIDELADDFADCLHSVELEIKRVDALCALEESEARYRALFEGAAEGIIMCEPEKGAVRYSNPAFCNMLGYTAEELSLMVISDLHPAALADLVKAEYGGQISGTKSTASELPCTKKDGTVFYAEVKAQLISFPAGENIVGFFTNITDKRSTQLALRNVLEELQASEDKFRSVAQTAPDAIITCDSVGRIVFWNAAAERTFGYSQEEVSDSDIGIIMPANVREKQAEYMMQYAESHVSNVVGKTVELTAKSKDGRSFPVELSLAAWDSSGETFFSAIIRDITDRLDIYLELDASRKSFANIVERSEDGILVVDHKGFIRFANDSAATVFGTTAKELMNQLFGIALNVGKKIEISIIREDGEPGVAEMATQKTIWDDREASLIMLRDITDRKRVEETLLDLNNKLKAVVAKLQDLDRTKSEFIANMSHELKTPLNAILGYISLMDEGIGGEITEKQKKWLGSMARQSKDLLDLIQQILDFSKLEAGKLMLNPQSLQLPMLLSDLHGTAVALAQDKDVEVILNADPSVRELVTDAGRLKQILVNLLSNAVKFTEKGEIELSVEMIDEDNILFAVRDTGIGIAAADQRRIFNPFEQIDGSMTRRFGGTGLGLPIVSRLVGLLDGDLSVKSEVGKGSRFEVVIPKTIEAKTAEILSYAPATPNSEDR